MTRVRTSARARWCGVVIALGIASGLTSSRDSVPTEHGTLVIDFAKLLPSLFPALSAQSSIVTGSDGNTCTNGDVNSGNQVTITIERLAGRTTGGTEVVFSEDSRSVNLLGAPGTTLADRFFEGLEVPAGEYDRLNIRRGSQFIYKGAVQCVIGGQTRYYHSNGNPDPPSPFVTTSLAAASAAAVSTTVTVGGDTDFPLSVNYTIVENQTTVVNIAFDPTVAVYDVGGGAHAVFPGSNATGAQAQ